jgi:hypothetical protein
MMTMSQLWTLTQFEVYIHITIIGIFTNLYKYFCRELLLLIVRVLRWVIGKSIICWPMKKIVKTVVYCIEI